MSTNIYLHKLIKTVSILVLIMNSLFLFQAGIAQNTKKANPQLQPILKSESREGFLEFREGANIKVTNIFSLHKEALGLGPQDLMVKTEEHKDKYGYTTYRFHQTYKSIPVEFADIIVSEKDNEAKSMIGHIAKNININVIPTINESTALQYALNHINATVYSWQVPAEEQLLRELNNDPAASYYPKGSLCIINDDNLNNSGAFHLAWKFNINSTSPLKNEDIYIDANSGHIIHENSKICNAGVLATAWTRYSGIRRMMTYLIADTGGNYYITYDDTRGNGIKTVNIKKHINNAPVDWFKNYSKSWHNVNAQHDEVATDVHWGMETAYDYYNTTFGRNGWNGAGGEIYSKVHYKVNWFNAAWTGSIFIIGDGDSTFCGPVTSIDVLGHEFTHAVTQSSVTGGGLEYLGESGALNESFSDIFGVAISFYAGRGKWSIAEDIYNTPHSYLRSLQNPKSGGPPQPDTYQLGPWASTANPDSTNDHGGVHTNSGVQNKWFYLLAMGGSGKNDKGNKYKVKGIGLKKASEIAYRTLTTKLNKNSQYIDAYNGSIAAAKEIYLLCTDEVVQCMNAWYAVGIGNRPLHIDTAIVVKSKCDKNNGSISVQATGVTAQPCRYFWTTNDTTATIDSLEPGNYTVIITDPFSNCTIDSTFIVEEDVNFKESISHTDLSSCGSNDGTALLTLTNVHGTPDISWSSGQSTQYIEDLAKGTYYVFITDTNTSCHKIDSVIITSPKPVITVMGGGERVICEDDPMPVFTFTAEVENCDGCIITWSTGETGASISGGPGDYSATASDTNGCYATASGSAILEVLDCKHPVPPTWEIPIVASQDPNEMVGPSGYGPSMFVSKFQDEPYTIHFTNDPKNATAPALKVTIDAPFDQTVEMNSLHLGDFGFGNFVFSVPPNSAFYSTRLDLRDSLNIYLDVTAGIDINNRKAFWILQSIDPATGVEPNDPNLGFLRVDDSITHKGEGYVSYTQKAASNTSTGDTIHAAASIVFDANDPLPTNQWTNIIDAHPPVTHVNALTASTDSTTFSITITGQDDAGGSGLKTISLYAALGNGTFAKVADYAPGESISYTGSPGNTYGFFSLGTDNTGNTENIKSTPEASIHINAYQPVIMGHLTYDNSISSPMNNVRLYLSNSAGFTVDSLITGGDGGFQFKIVPPGKYIISAVTGKPWGGITATDALLVLKDFMGINPLSGLRKLAADVNASGFVNSVDAMFTAERFVGLMQNFTSGDWAFQRDTLILADSSVDYNMKALCFGDVDGSYLPPEFKQAPVVRLYNEGTLSVHPGKEILVPVFVKEPGKFGAISLVMSYQPDLMDISGVIEGKDVHGNLVYKADNGMLRIAWYGPAPLSLNSGDAMLFIKINLKEAAAGANTGFRLEDQGSIADANAKVIPGVSIYMPKLTIENSPLSFSVSNHPNPFSTLTEIEYSLPAEARVKLTVYNSLGEDVSVPVNESQDKGEHVLMFDGSRLSNGVYIGKLEAEGPAGKFSSEIKLVISRLKQE